MTERGRADLARDSNTLSIGASSLRWDGTTLVFDIDERAIPHLARLKGTVRVHPASLALHEVTIDSAGQHRWSPIAPVAHVEVDLPTIGLSWQGPGYLDSNFGDSPMESAFPSWHWSRAETSRGTAVLYDVLRRDGTRLHLAQLFDSQGNVSDFEAPPRAPLPRGFWRVARATRAEPGTAPEVARTLEDAPFYVRSMVRTRLLGENVVAMHESLDLDRFSSKIVQMMLPFRMPRRARKT